MAWSDAIGVRRSWLAQATSSRLASKSSERFDAISLNECESSASSAGPPSSARAERSPAASAADELRRWSSRWTMPWARKRPTSTAADADALATARILTSSPMWNMTQPERSTAPSGKTTASSASPASCRRTVGRSLRSRATTRPMPSVAAATMSASWITVRTGSRSPRPSPGAPAGTGRFRASLADGERGR